MRVVRGFPFVFGSGCAESHLAGMVAGRDLVQTT